MTIGRPRIAVTGVGMVTALGEGAASTFQKLVAGATGIRPIQGMLHGCSSRPVVAQIAFERDDEKPPLASRSEEFAKIAAREAIDSAGLSGQVVALILGASTGATAEGIVDCDLPAAPSILPFVRRLASQPIGSMGHHLRAALGNVSAATVVCSACSSGALAIAIGAMRLEHGDPTPQVVGATDSLNLLTLSGFASLGAMSRDACRPFDAARSGLNLGEGSGFLVLETEGMAERRGANVLAWLDGYAIGAEAHHLTHPQPDGARAAQLIRAALARAGLAAAEIDYVNAHGTATLANDAMECVALRDALGTAIALVPTSSSKGQVGHTLAAAGAIEAAILVQALVTQTIPPTVGLGEAAPDCQLLHVPERGVHRELRAALSNSFGFGGACAVLAMQRSERPAAWSSERGTNIALEYLGSPKDNSICVTGIIACGEAGILRGPDAAKWLDQDRGKDRVELPFEPLQLLVMERSRRFDRVSALAAFACETLCDDAGWSTARRMGATAPVGHGHVGLVLGNALGPVERTAHFVERVLQRGPKGANPAEFPHLLPSSAPSNASIYVGLQGPVFSVSELGATMQAALELGVDFLHAQLATAMLVGTVEVREDCIVQTMQDRLWDCNDGAAFLLLERRATALERGATGCEVGAVGWLAETAPDDCAPPLPNHQNVVLWASEHVAAQDDALRRLGWSTVTCRLCIPGAHSGWSHPGFVLAAGAGLVSSGACGSAMVISDSSRGLHFAVFRRSSVLQLPRGAAGKSP